MEKINNIDEFKRLQRLNNIINSRTHSDYLKSNSVEHNETSTKNVFLSLPKLNTKTHNTKKSFLKNINLTFNNRPNKTEDHTHAEASTNTENTNENKLKKIMKIKKRLINIKLIGRKNNSNFPKNLENTILIDNIHFNKFYLTNEIQNFNNTYKNEHIDILKRIKTINPSYNIFTSKKNTKTQGIDFYQKKPNLHYISPDNKNLQTLRLNNLSNLKRLNVGDLMKKEINKNNCICLLDDDNKELNDLNNDDFKVGDKYSSENKINNLKERNEYYSKLKLLYNKNNRGKKLRKKFTSFKNNQELLNYYKNNRILNYRKLIEKTIVETKKSKRNIANYFGEIKNTFDIYDDWNDPKNENNLYDS